MPAATDPTDDSGDGAGLQSSSYARWTGSKRGEARRQDLLDKVTADVAANGLVDFSLRRAAAAAGTTHKVLLYYFDGPDDLLAEAVKRLRQRRGEGLRAVLDLPPTMSLADRLRATWPNLVRAEANFWVITQAMGLVMYDPVRYGHLGRDEGRQYHAVLLGMCPAGWAEERKSEVVELILAVFRGLLLDARVRRTPLDDAPAFRALLRALEDEEARP
ncbi:hypothetical protein [Microlunatus speluncae]|uniref:hypothetical protein n=1 Tax=Microlunatus speluncae TaxID=2594267 RepID=UPI001C2DAFEE|nr:hypothetical protein [Microlunatus speluncae]